MKKFDKGETWEAMRASIFVDLKKAGHDIVFELRDKVPGPGVVDMKCKRCGKRGYAIRVLDNLSAVDCLGDLFLILSGLPVPCGGTIEVAIAHQSERKLSDKPQGERRLSPAGLSFSSIGRGNGIKHGGGL